MDLLRMRRSVLGVCASALVVGCAGDTLQTDVVTTTDATATDTTATDTSTNDTLFNDTGDVVIGDTITADDFGAPCRSNSDCLSGYCVPGVDGLVCTRACTTACPVGWDCHGATDLGPDLVFVCVPEVDKLCEPCETDGQCDNGVCSNMVDGAHCTRPCSSGRTCPPGFECVDDALGGGDVVADTPQCVPIRDDCSCTWRTPGEVRQCVASNAIGTCAGVEVCEGAAGWSACSARVPDLEQCNGQDDDCNGDVDDGPTLPDEACTHENTFGSCVGAWICGGLSGWACIAEEPEAERCDHRDNDCDGAVDEDFRDAESGIYASDLHCGGCGTSCVDALDHGTGRCAVDDGHARCVLAACDPGYYPASETVCRPVEDTSCAACSSDASCLVPGNVCAAIDGTTACAVDCGPGNYYGRPAGECPSGYACADLGGHHACLPESGSCSCRGEADLSKVRACVVSNELGACTGTETCRGDRGWAPCSARVPDVETCNGVDDDCDGDLDDHVVPPEAACAVTNEAGTCAATWTCAGADGWLCPAQTPAVDRCDHRDEDCDGATDEDFRDPITGLYVADTDCGACGFDCTAALPHAVSGCAVVDGDPECQIVACDPGWFQLSERACGKIVDTLCTPCADDASCVVPGNRCLPLDGGSACGRDCSAGNLAGLPAGLCPDGYACVPQADGPDQCEPLGGSCACITEDDAGKMRPCLVANAFGVCPGERTCVPPDGFSPCTARVPTAERCNGEDDDCNGLVDEGAPAPTEPCEIANAHGRCTGAWVCGGAAGFGCTAATPAADVCNGRDDDCDGATDEDFRDALGRYVSDDEHCGLCGVSCVGAIPFATASTCGLEGATPVCKVVACMPGYELPEGSDRACVPIGGATDCSPCTEEVHCASLPGGACTALDRGTFCTRGCADDDACRDGYACVAGRCLPESGSCTCLADDVHAVRLCVDENAAGRCLGTESCDPETGWSACTAATPSDEICNGKDDDCDGFVDEALTREPATCEVANAHGTCRGLWSCGGDEGWICSAATPRAETCDYRDENCDGVADEPWRDPATGAYVADDSCGACGISCVGAIPHATATCVAAGGAPRCEVAGCEPGWFQAGRLTCLPASDSLCAPCDPTDGCPTPGDACVALDGGAACGRDCSVDNVHGLPADACPDGFACMDVGAAHRQCLPISGSCACLPGDAGELRTCVRSGPAGTCYGVETCAPEAGGWQSCNARVPAFEICNGEDDDCDGRVDEVVSAPTEPCAVTNDFGTCTGEWQCGGADGWRCTATASQAEACDYRDNDCDGAVDEGFRDEAGRYVTDDHCGTCGNACGRALPHATGRCDVSSGEPRCVVAACDAGFYQVAATSCLPLQDLRCTPCAEDANCVVPGNACVTLEDGSFCGRDCSAGNLYGLPAGLCPEGFVCAPEDGGHAQCVPVSGSCSCLGAGDVGKTRSCLRGNAEGTCLGSSRCEGTDGWTPCSARVPTAEDCDGEDDDCDGLVDENVAPPTAPCAVENAAGRCEGAWTCQGPGGWRCGAATPAAEACNGDDDDCDGAIDEGFVDPATGQYLSDGNCGVCGNSCVGAIPFALATACAYEGGRAVCVATACMPGYEHPPGTERSCAPMGGVTDCAPCTEDVQCASMPGGKCELVDRTPVCTRACVDDGDCGDDLACEGGRCRPLSGSCSCRPGDGGDVRVCFEANAAGTCIGTETCDPTRTPGWGACTAATPQTEVCNGADDDCDGRADEDVVKVPATCEVVNAAGTCHGLWSCTGAGGWVCSAKTPALETCDYVDDDCDGAIDETYKDEQGRYATDAGCGACGVTCAGVIPHATAACSVVSGAPRCEVLACAPGYYQVGPLTCLPAVDTLCAPCESDANCPTPGDRCLVVDGVGRCGQDCAAGNVRGTAAGVCPAGFGCVAVGLARECVPTSGSCTCLAQHDGATRSCVVQNAIGACFGTETCDADGAGWSGCTAPTPTVEVCNGVDDDCDVLVDDVAGRGEPCAVANAFGTCSGKRECAAGQSALMCSAPTPRAELCNGVDDDCDGLVDETFADLLTPCSSGKGLCKAQGVQRCAASGLTTACDAVPGEPRAEVCDGLDDDCDGATDEGAGWTRLGTPCVVGRGGCTAIGLWRCDDDPTAPEVCGATAGAPTAEQCNGLDDDCDGATDEVEDLPRSPCENQVGVCLGATRTCGGVHGWLACNGNEYGADYQAIELACDGLDNDCDGFVDETLPSSPCANQIGVCAGSTARCGGEDGFLACDATRYGPSYEPVETRCDYLDNDCDGTVDDGFRAVDGTYRTQDHCGVCGRSCTGAIPHATAVCGGDLAAPRCVVAACEPGYLPVGDNQCVPASLGLCDPCVAAETCVLPGATCASLDDGRFCLSPCPATGGCPAGFGCEAVDGGRFCVPVTFACTCDGGNVGIERGCAVDHTGPLGDYQCFGRQACGASGWSTCALPEESCNLVDDDCDGATDEGFVDADGRYQSDLDCGACGNDCTLLVFAGAAGVCNTHVDPPVCSVKCDATCFDLDANPSNGCECCDPTPHDWPDPLGIDANCDGIDGEIDNGVFVAKDGDDLAPGTIRAPKRTIQAGIDAAVVLGKRDVYVATGVYEEAITLHRGVGVYGGYASDFRVRDALRYEVAILAPEPDLARPGAVNAIDIRMGAAQATVFAGFTVFGARVEEPSASSYAIYVRDCDDSVAITGNEIHAGMGGRGLRGGDGVDGGDGTSGGDGRAAFDVLAATGVSGHGCAAAGISSSGGAGGQSACGTIDTSGGAGGNRVCPVYPTADNKTVPPVASEHGRAGAFGAAAGGAAGRDVYHQRFSCMGYDTFGDVEGGNGEDGSGGVDGEAGGGCADVDGDVVGGLWRPAVGGDGAAGVHGGGGGGGGSGAGAWAHESCDAKGYNYDNLGGTGGGGGSGGCGATPGTAGTSGGGAFGIFVVFQTAPARIPTVAMNLLYGGRGGDAGAGGNGGMGGSGGAGGFGGEGGGEPVPAAPSYPAFEGGKGGKGGNGGDGGGGGGGCGGPTFGLYAHGQGALDLGAWRTSNDIADPGEGGAGGHGGYSVGFPGGDGQSGLAATTNF